MKKIYLENPYKNTLVTGKTAVEGEDNLYLPEETIFLKKTPHYDEDLPTINGERREDGSLIIKGEENESVTLSLSGKERMQFLQDSMARILLTISIRHLLDEKTVDYRIGKDCWLEIQAKDLSFVAMEQIEDLTNYLLQGDFLFRKEEYAEDDSTRVRVGKYPPVFHFGPCLRRTGEVSLIKIIGLAKNGERLRIRYVSGMNAFRRFREDENLLRNLRMQYDVKENKDIERAAKKLMFAKDSLAEDNKKMQEELGLDAMNDYLKMATTYEGRHFIYRVLRGVNFKELKFISGKIMDKPDYVQIYGIPNGSMSQVLVCISKNILGNLKDVYDEIKEDYPLTGGGNLYRIQANCPTSSLPDVMEEFLKRLRKF